MRILADYHHDDLFHSLRILFEERMGWELYRPIGLEWFQQGFWRVYNHPATAEQFLGLHIGSNFTQMKMEHPEGEFRWLNEGLKEVSDGLYSIPDPCYGKTTYGVTLPMFSNMKFDVILSSMPDHFTSFERLRQQFQPQAKHIFQAGNNWPVPSGCLNFLNSTKPERGGNAVFYHQEFDRNIYCPRPCHNPKTVTSMLHYNGTHGRLELMALELMMKEWKIRERGAGNRDGGVNPGEMHKAMQDTGFVWHVKNGGDGYGYNIHHALACGRPVIYRGSLIKGQTAADVLQHGVTGIDLDVVGLAGLPSILNDWAGRFPVIIDQVHTRFKQVVDFDAEFVRVKAFLENLA